MYQTLKTRGSNALSFLTGVVFLLSVLSVSAAAAQTKPWFPENSYWLRGSVERFDRDTAHSVVRLLKKVIQGHEQSRVDLIAIHSRFIEPNASVLRLDQRVAEIWKELPGLPKNHDRSNRLGLLLDKDLRGEHEGVLVTAVDPGFQPNEIRIFPGDRIVAINAILVTSANDVIRLTRSNPPGKSMRLTLESDLGDKDITMTPRSPASTHATFLAHASLLELAMVLEELIRAGLAPDSQLILDVLSMIDFQSNPLNDSVWSQGTRYNILNSLGVLIRSLGAGLESGSLEWTESVANTVSRIILKAHFLSHYQVILKNSDVSWSPWRDGQRGLIRLLRNLQEKYGPDNLLGDPMLRAITATYDFPFIYDYLETTSVSDQVSQAIGVISDFNAYTAPVIYQYQQFLPLIEQLEYVADSYELRLLERFDWSSIDEGVREWAMTTIRQFHTTMSRTYEKELKGENVVPAHLEEVETFHQRIKRFRQKNVTFFEAHNSTEWKDWESARRLGERLYWFKMREIQKIIDVAEAGGRYEAVLSGNRKLVSIARSAFGASHRVTLGNTNLLLHSLGGFGLVDEARAYIDEVRPHYQGKKNRLEKEIEWAGFLKEKEKQIALIERYRDIYAPNLAKSNFPLAYDLLILYTSNAPHKLKARSGKLLVAQIKKTLSETKAGWAPGEGEPRDDEERYDNEQYKKFSLLGITLADALANENHQALITWLADLVNMVSSELEKDGSMNPHYRNFPITLAVSLGALGHESTAAELLRKTIALFEKKEKLYQGDIAVASILLAGQGANKGEHIESRQYLNKARNIFSSGAPIVVPDHVSESLLRGIAVILNLSIRDDTPLDVAVAIADDQIHSISDNANGLSGGASPWI